MKRLLVAALSAAALVVPSIAHATILTFETVPSLTFISNGYGGLNWSNMGAINATSDPFYEGSGYISGRKSGDTVAFNSGGDVATVLAGSAPFTLNEGYFTAGWNNGLTLTVQGFTGGSVAAFTKTVTLNVAGSTLVEFGWAGLTSVSFASSGGSRAAGVSGAGTQFVLDDLRVNEAVAAVPEPATWGMMILGFAAIGAVQRRRVLGTLARAA